MFMPNVKLHTNFKELFYIYSMAKTLFYRVLQLFNIPVYVIVFITETHASVYNVFES